MNSTDYSKMLCEKITELRKSRGMTQDALAAKLGITFQAVSKWENGVSCPDITLLPEIAGIFEVSVDELFGIAGRQAAPAREAQTENDGNAQARSGGNTQTESCLPWGDDDTVRIAVFRGRNIVDSFDGAFENLEIRLTGEVRDVESRLSISCDTIQGDAKAGVNIQCDEIGGDATAGCDIHCDEIGGNATAGCDIQCDDIGGDADAGGSIRCDTISGDVVCTGAITCDCIEGDVTQKGNP